MAAEIVQIGHMQLAGASIHLPVVILMCSFDARKEKQDACIDLSVSRSQAYFCESEPHLYFASSKLHHPFLFVCIIKLFFVIFFSLVAFEVLCVRLMSE